MNKRFAEITGWGKCIPPNVLTNDDLSTFMDTDDEWIYTRTGIKQRNISHVGCHELASVAAQRALACADADAKDIDLIILATCSPTSLIPNTATFVQEAIGAGHAAAFDLNSACTGFLYGLNTATSMIQSGAIDKVLLIASEHLTWYIDWAQRDSAVLFGDGAGAVVIEATDQELGVLGYAQANNPEAKDCLRVNNFGTNIDKSQVNLNLQFQGKEIFKQAVPGMVEVSMEALKRAHLTVEDIQLVIPHQANTRIIEAVVTKLGGSLESTFINITNYGNTSAATIPIAICDALEKGLIKEEQMILFTAFGAGLTSAASVLKWGKRTSAVRESDAELPKSELSALELIRK